MKYYVYRHIRLDKNEPFYIGIGTKKDKNFKKITSEYYRAYIKSKRSKFWNNIVNKTNYKIEIIYETNDKKEALVKEREFIKLYGKRTTNNGTLVNLTDGGDGSNEFRLSNETKKKMSKSYKKEKHTYLSKKCFHIDTKKEFNSLREGCDYFNISYGAQKMAIKNKRTTAQFMFIGEEFLAIKRKIYTAKECVFITTNEKFESLRSGCKKLNIKYTQQLDAIRLNLTTKKFKFI